MLEGASEGATDFATEGARDFASEGARDFASDGATDFASKDSWRSGVSEAGGEVGEVGFRLRWDRILST